MQLEGLMENSAGKDFSLTASDFHGNHLGSSWGQLRSALMHDYQQIVGMIRAKPTFEFRMRMPGSSLYSMGYHWT